MSFELAFHPEALREWNRLDAALRTQFKKKLAERLIEPRVAAHRLRGPSERYKIKLRAAGYRLVYEVHDQQLLVLVLVVGRRDRSAVYRQADRR
jgi:mRNA interferase RelE/StbE